MILFQPSGNLARADRECADLLSRGEAAAQEQARRLVSAAGMASRQMTLAAKQEMLDEAFALALDKLCLLYTSRCV